MTKIFLRHGCCRADISGCAKKFCSANFCVESNRQTIGDSTRGTKTDKIKKNGCTRAGIQHRGCDHIYISSAFQTWTDRRKSTTMTSVPTQMCCCEGRAAPGVPPCLPADSSGSAHDSIMRRSKVL
jgi:hypothetical protein